MIVVADQNIPFIADAFADLGEVRLYPGREIGKAQLRDCRCLVTRTVTRVDARLLEGTPVEFVGTATIGTDHVDLDYLQRAGIGFSNAAGCNAEAAAEYVVSGIFALSARQGFDPFLRRAGIVGYGNVGSRLVDKLETLGIECLVCDPPLAARGETARDFVDLDTLLDECDLLSLHVPLTRGGDHPTFHLLGAPRLKRLRRGCLLINAARGEVVDNTMLLHILRSRRDLRVFLDTWEGEPRVSRELLVRVDLATPHIAGYSVEGRLRGTQMVLDAACRHFAAGSRWHMPDLLPPIREIELDADGPLACWQRLFGGHCDIWRDHEAFTAGANLDDDGFAAHFDSLRRVYDDRIEYARCRVRQAPGGLPRSVLERLGFLLGD